MWRLMGLALMKSQLSRSWAVTATFSEAAITMYARLSFSWLCQYALMSMLVILDTDLNCWLPTIFSFVKFYKLFTGDHKFILTV